MGQNKSRSPGKENSTRMHNVPQMKYGAQHDRSNYNSESSMHQRRQGGHNYEQQHNVSPMIYAGPHDPRGKPLKSKRKSEKKKKDKKPKKSKHAPVSERSVSKEQKHEKKGEVHTTEQGHMVSGTKMKDRSHDPASESASGWIHSREHNNLDYHAVQIAGPSTSFSTFSEKRKEDSDKELKQMKELLSRKEEELHSLRLKANISYIYQVPFTNKLVRLQAVISLVDAGFPDGMEERISRKDEELHGVRQDLENTRGELGEKIRKYEEDLERKTEKIKHLEAEKNDLLNRLSSEAAARMTYNNPNISDLSDQDRPTKISERYAELYDNQWTDAFQNLQKSYQLSDTEVIEVLLDVLYTSFDVCKKIRKQREALVRYLTEYVGEAGGNVIVCEVMTILKGAKKKNIAEMQKDYKKRVQEVLETKYSKVLQCIGPYVNECVELCLLMNIQDPALELKGVVLGENPFFDVAVFRPYTKSGSRIEHIVWPALYLFNNGPLLYRGVAQGTRDSSEGHKSTIIKVHTSKEEH